MSLGKEDVFWERGSFITKNERMDCCFSQRRGESLSPRELPKSHRGPPCGREVVCFSSRGVNGTHRVTGSDMQWLLVDLSSASFPGDAREQMKLALPK